MASLDPQPRKPCLQLVISPAESQQQMQSPNSVLNADQQVYDLKYEQTMLYQQINSLQATVSGLETQLKESQSASTCHSAKERITARSNKPTEAAAHRGVRKLRCQREGNC
jgi:uncharacterized protein YlxW (UPF0749 family)